MFTDKLTVVSLLCMLAVGVSTPSRAAQVAREAKQVSTEIISLQKTEPQEPTILELQRAAIRYAEVNPDKITNWRRQATLKALMPEISVGYDTDIYRTISTATKDGKTNFFVGPDDQSRGWDVSASWDLGDLVYNSAQTSIDSRSKLMVQLRNDILTDLNTAYFERKKLLRQLDRIQDKESPSCTERELRIEELTATIDGLTGGYLSRRLGKE